MSGFNEQAEPEYVAERIRVTVDVTDTYFTDEGETAQTVAEALRNDFDEVAVRNLERLVDTDPTTGIRHYKGMESH